LRDGVPLIVSRSDPPKRALAIIEPMAAMGLPISSGDDSSGWSFPLGILHARRVETAPEEDGEP
jgi:hypothetical protein